MSIAYMAQLPTTNMERNRGSESFLSWINFGGVGVAIEVGTGVNVSLVSGSGFGSSFTQGVSFCSCSGATSSGPHTSDSNAYDILSLFFYINRKNKDGFTNVNHFDGYRIDMCGYRISCV